MPEFPSRTDKKMAELCAFERQLHAVLYPIFDVYARPSTHDIGIAMKQAGLLARDIDFLCGQIEEEYHAACGDREDIEVEA